MVSSQGPAGNVGAHHQEGRPAPSGTAIAVMPAAITIVRPERRPEIRIGEYEVIGVEADLGDRLEERSVEKL